MMSTLAKPTVKFFVGRQRITYSVLKVKAFTSGQMVQGKRAKGLKVRVQELAKEIWLLLKEIFLTSFMIIAW